MVRPTATNVADYFVGRTVFLPCPHETVCPTCFSFCRLCWRQGSDECQHLLHCRFIIHQWTHFTEQFCSQLYRCHILHVLFLLANINTFSDTSKFFCYFLRRLGATGWGFLGAGLGANGSTTAVARRMRTSARGRWFLSVAIC